MGLQQRWRSAACVGALACWVVQTVQAQPVPAETAASAAAAAPAALAAPVAPAAPAAQLPPAPPTAATVPLAPKLLLRPPAVPELQWRGVLPTEGGAVGSGPQVGPYVVPGLAGLVAAIFTHAAINEGVKSAVQRRAQAEADAVLQPYQVALKAWLPSDLWNALPALAPATVPMAVADVGSGPADATAVHVLPGFAMSQDEAVLVADVALRYEGGNAGPPVERLVRVVSSPLTVADPRAHWLAGDGATLKQAAAAMVAHAVQLGHRHLKPFEGDVPTRTHRYLRGKVESMERGQLLHGECDRMVLLTLRGHLLSVPRSEPVQTPCTRSAGF